MVTHIITLAEQEGTGLDDLAAAQSAQTAFANANVATVFEAKEAGALGAKAVKGGKKQRHKTAGAKRAPSTDELKALMLQLDTAEVCAKYYCDNEGHC